MEKLNLANGMHVIIRPMSNTHSVTLGLYAKSGLAYQEPLIGITHLLEHMHFRCLVGMSQHELYYKMESIGSTLRATTYKNFIMFSMKVASCYLIDALEVFSRIIDTKVWDQNSVEAEKKVVLNQILETEGYSSLDKEVGKVVFHDHPLSNSIMGTPKQLKKIAPNDVTQYKKKIFNKENVLFCITGNINIDDQTQIKAILGKCSLNTTASMEHVSTPKHFYKRAPDVHLVHVEDDGPLEVNISFDIQYNERNHDLLTILNCILGEGVGSRLQMRIREEKKFSSNIYSYIEWFSDFAELHIRFSVEKRNLYECIVELSCVLKDLKTSVTKEDLDVSLPFYTTNQDFIEDDTEEMNFQIAYNSLVFGREYKRLELKNDRKTVEEIQHLAQEVFKLNNLSIVILGNTKRLTKNDIVNCFKTEDGSLS